MLLESSVGLVLSLLLFSYFCCFKQRKNEFWTDSLRRIITVSLSLQIFQTRNYVLNFRFIVKYF